MSTLRFNATRNYNVNITANICSHYFPIFGFFPLQSLLFMEVTPFLEDLLVIIISS